MPFCSISPIWFLIVVLHDMAPEYTGENMMIELVMARDQSSQNMMIELVGKKLFSVWLYKIILGRLTMKSNHTFH